MPKYIYSLTSKGVYAYTENFSNRNADFIILSEQEADIYDEWIVTLKEARANKVRPPSQPLFGPDAVADDYPSAEIVGKEATSPSMLNLAPEEPDEPELTPAIPDPEVEKALEGLLDESTS